MQVGEERLDGLLGIAPAQIYRPLKFQAICGPDTLMVDAAIAPAKALFTVTSTPASLLYYYIKDRRLQLTDWCFPKVNPEWYVGIDSHYQAYALLEHDDFPDGACRLMDYNVRRLSSKTSKKDVVVCSAICIALPSMHI